MKFNINKYIKYSFAGQNTKTFEKHKPRLVTKKVWVKVTTGVKPSPTQVYTPDHNSKLPFKNCRVNPDTVSKVIDENGDPLVVYHTRQKGNNFTEFKNGTAGLIWFANSKKASVLSFQMMQNLLVLQNLKLMQR